MQGFFAYIASARCKESSPHCPAVFINSTLDAAPAVEPKQRAGRMQPPPCGHVFAFAHHQVLKERHVLVIALWLLESV